MGFQVLDFNQEEKVCVPCMEKIKLLFGWMLQWDYQLEL